jgi:hypothetical protein
MMEMEREAAMNECEAGSNVAVMDVSRRTPQLKRMGYSVNRKQSEVHALNILTPPFVAESILVCAAVKMALCKHECLAFRRAYFFVGQRYQPVW